MKRDGRKLAHNTLEEMRIMAVQRMKEGEHPAQVAASFGMHRSWAYKCLAAARGRGKGIRALRSTKGTGRPRSLTRSQERQVFRWVNGKRPDQYGFDFGLWTRQIVKELLQQRFGIDLSLASVGTLLARLGLTAQKPLERAYQRDAKAVERWKQQTYPELAAQAKREKADILFWDESGFRADAVHGKTWAPKGQTPVVQRPGQRQSISAASAVSANGAFWYATYQGALTGELFVELLKSMMQGRQRPVKLVVDGLPAHKKAIVKEYVPQHRGACSVCTSCQGMRQTSIRMSLSGVMPSARGVARSPLKAGEKLQCRVESQLQQMASDTALIKSFFKHPSVSYISDL
jgi:transposase